MISRKLFLAVISCSVLALKANENVKVDPVNETEKDIKEKLLASSEQKKSEMEKKQKEKKKSKDDTKKVLDKEKVDLWTAHKNKDIEAFKAAIKAGQSYRSAGIKEAQKGNVEGVIELNYLDESSNVLHEKCEAALARSRWIDPATKLGYAAFGALCVGAAWVITSYFEVKKRS